MVLRRIAADGSLEPVGGVATTTGFKYIGTATPTATGWNPNDLWLDTNLLSTSVAPTIRVWDGSVFKPTPASGSPGGVTLLADTFSGADAAVWDATKWSLGRNASTGTGGGATLLSGTGRLQTSNTGGYAPGATVARQAIFTTPPADTNVECSIKFDTTECFFSCYVRHDTNAVDGNNAYAININPLLGTWNVSKQTLYSTSLLGTEQMKTFDPGVWYRFRFKVIGTAIQARVWNLGVTEPVFAVSVTDSTYTAAGKVGMCLRTGNATTSSRVFLDDLIIRNS